MVNSYSQHEERKEFYNVILKGKNQLKFLFVSPWKKFITSAGSKMERSTTFPMKHSGWALLSAEGWPCYRWVGRWRRCLAVRRTEGNFTAATGVALNLINLNAGKECVKATGGNIQIYINIHIAAEIGSLRSVVGVSGSLTSGRNQCSRVFNSWNTFFVTSWPLYLCLPFAGGSVGTIELAKSQPRTHFCPPLPSRWTTSWLSQETANDWLNNQRVFSGSSRP